MTMWFDSVRGGSGAALLALALLGAGHAVHAQPAAPEDWPCVQRFVPGLSPGTLWPVPIDTALADTWRDDPRTLALARYLGELESVDDAAREAMAEYAESLPETKRRGALTRLADGIVGVADQRRSRYLEGIRRFTRKQSRIAGDIESTLNRRAELEDAAAATEGASEESEEGAAPGAAERVEIEERLLWQERLYDQRERAIRALCERPVVLEETLSEVLRELAYHLPDA